ncbi:MAG: acetyl-CoA carboxylase biotin carboxyl carrier protein subunit, partial [Deltaproteobacteria bacterium]|nr:acetyl-CoA carboxylase biotin carboxyl carrier protein subunit [Deltaproteobacteria bacterium]
GVRYEVQIGDKLATLEWGALDAQGHTEVTALGSTTRVRLTSPGPHRLRAIGPQGARTLYAVRSPEWLWIWADGRARLVGEAQGRRTARRGGGAQQAVTPPMPAVVTKVLVQVGQQVAKGEPLVVVSAMKMEMTLSAPHAGTVVAIRVAPGAKGSPGDVLVDVQPGEPAGAGAKREAGSP